MEAKRQVRDFKQDEEDSGSGAEDGGDGAIQRGAEFPERDKAVQPRVPEGNRGLPSDPSDDFKKRDQFDDDVVRVLAEAVSDPVCPEV